MSGRGRIDPLGSGSLGGFGRVGSGAEDHIGEWVLWRLWVFAGCKGSAGEKRRVWVLRGR